MFDVPWNAPARLFDHVSRKWYPGSLTSAVARWLGLPPEAQALAIVHLDSSWMGQSALRAADIRELLLEDGAPQAA